MRRAAPLGGKRPLGRKAPLLGGEETAGWTVTTNYELMVGVLRRLDLQARFSSRRFLVSLIVAAGNPYVVNAIHQKLQAPDASTAKLGKRTRPGGNRRPPPARRNAAHGPACR